MTELYQRVADILHSCTTGESHQSVLKQRKQTRFIMNEKVVANTKNFGEQLKGSRTIAVLYFYSEEVEFKDQFVAKSICVLIIEGFLLSSYNTHRILRAISTEL